MNRISRVDNTPRAMWLLNHTAARRFEIPMLKRSGINEIFLPKLYPNDPNFRTASLDFSEDENLTIPADELKILNDTDWYSGGTKKSWEIANRYFDIVFAIMYDPQLFEIAQRRFGGAFLWRAYGLSNGNTYSKVIKEHTYYAPARGPIQALGERFWFAEGYEHLHEVEDAFLASRAIFLPLGMNSASAPKFDSWRGSDKRILFVCPDIGYNRVYEDIYAEFKRNFGDLPYVVGGAQPISVADPRVLGYLPADQYARNMREMRVMFYHSSEPRHIHFHPFEAVAAGMPLIFMHGGILDRFGGRKLPGRCKDIAEARKKITRILNGDQQFIDSIRKSQTVLLDAMKPENCVRHWINGIATVLSNLSQYRSEIFEESSKLKRIGILATRTTLTDAIALSKAIRSEADGSIETVIGLEVHPDGKRPGFEKAVSGVREFEWEPIDPAQARRTFLYDRSFKPVTSSIYSAPNDGINYFRDCDLWILMSRDINHPILPMRPFALRVKLEKSIKGEGTKSIYREQRLPGIEHSADVIIVENTSDRDHITGLEGVPTKKVRLVGDLKSLSKKRNGAPVYSSYLEALSEFL